MRLGDHLCVEDYDAIWGEPKRADRPSILQRMMLLVLVLGLTIGVAIVAGCDGEAAQATAQAEQEAHDKKVALMSHPCAWVAQCGHPISDCPINARRCVRSADFRSE